MSMFSNIFKRKNTDLETDEDDLQHSSFRGK